MKKNFIEAAKTTAALVIVGYGIECGRELYHTVQDVTVICGEKICSLTKKVFKKKESK